MPRPRKGGYVVSDAGKKLLPKYNISVGERRTTVRLAPEFYKAIEKIAETEHCNAKKIFEFIAATKENGIGMSTAAKVFVIQYFMAAATEEGHRDAGHGSLIETGLIPKLQLGDRQKFSGAHTKEYKSKSACELAEIGQLLYGIQWKTELARHLGVSRQTVTRWAES